MAYFTNYIRAPLQSQAMPDFSQEAAQAYRNAQLPRWLQSKQKILDLENQSRSIKNQYAPELWQGRLQQLGLANQAATENLKFLPEMMQEKLRGLGLSNAAASEQLAALPNIIKMKEALAQAQLTKAGMPSYSSPIGKMLNDYNNAVKQFGADSPQAKILSDAITSAQQGSPGGTVTVQGADGQNYIMKLPTSTTRGGVSQPVVAPDGTVVSAGTTAATTKFQNQQIATVVRTLMANSPLFNMPNRYIGPGGSAQLSNDMEMYNDPNTPAAAKAILKPQITQAITANQSVYELTAKTLQGLGLNAGVTMTDDLKKNLTAQWPDFAGILGKYKIPKDIAVDVNNLVRVAPEDLGAGMNYWVNNGRQVDKNGYPILNNSIIHPELLPQGVTSNDVLETSQKYNESPMKVIQTVYDLKSKEAGL